MSCLGGHGIRKLQAADAMKTPYNHTTAVMNQPDYPGCSDVKNRFQDVLADRSGGLSSRPQSGAQTLRLSPDYLHSEALRRTWPALGNRRSPAVTNGR